MNTTSDGTPCDLWNLPGQSFATPPNGSNHYYCRHVSSDTAPNAWCYTTQTGTRYKNCAIPLCGKKIRFTVNFTVIFFFK